MTRIAASQRDPEERKGPAREWWLKDSCPWVLFVGRFGLPESGAVFHRFHMIARALRDEGYQVALLPETFGGRPEDRDKDGLYRYDGFPYFPVESEGDAFGKLGTRIKRAIGVHNPSLRWLEEFWPRKIHLHAVITAFLPTACLNGVASFFRQQKVPVIFDDKEWYDPSNFPNWAINPNYYDFQLLRYWLLKRIGNTLAISTLLEEFNRQRGCRVLRLPVLVDVRAVLVRAKDDHRDRTQALSVAYTGSPGRGKDNLWVVLEGMHLARKKGHDVRLRVVGPSREQLLSFNGVAPDVLTELGDNITFTGRVPASIARQEMAAADFTILVRPDRRYARAGFPTKVVESLCAGTPVILSPVGDVALFLQDGREAIFVREVAPEAVCHALSQAAVMSREEHGEMRAAARRCAEDNFDYRIHAGAIAGFIKESQQRVMAFS